MRFIIAGAAVVAVLGLARPAMAQVSPATILGGVPPSAIQQKAIDTSRVIAPTPALSAQQNRFNFTSLFSKMSMPSYPSKRGLSPQPIPSSFPSSNYNPFKMVGRPPVLLGDPRKSAMPMNVPTPVIPSMGTPVGPGSGG